MFHIGHLNILRRAKEHCDFLIVGVTTDELCFKRKHKYPIINEHDRMAIVEAIKYVDKVVSIDVDELKQDILNEASLRTYEAYGRKQLEFAINNLINNKKFNGFVNDDNVRLHLINKVSPDEVKNIIKNDLLSNNYPGSIIQEKYITLYINKIEKEAKG